MHPTASRPATGSLNRFSSLSRCQCDNTQLQLHAAIFWDARLLAVTIKPNKAKTRGRQQAEAVSDAPRARACRFVLRVSNLRLNCCVRRPINSQSS